MLFLLQAVLVEQTQSSRQTDCPAGREQDCSPNPRHRRDGVKIKILMRKHLRGESMDFDGEDNLKICNYNVLFGRNL